MIFSKQRLPSGTVIDQYKIDKAIGGGGFSVVYFGKSIADHRSVVIKEYMPRKLARRGRDLQVAAADKSLIDSFNRGRQLFFQEAKTLAKLTHPNIVQVINFFQANGTAYMVMPYERGRNLATYIRSHKGNLSEKFLLTVFGELFEGLHMVHGCAILHLDIKPGNIHLRPGGKPLLFDFGAVHEFATTRRKQAGRVLTTGFSPIELYQEGGYVGPWSDIYSLGATMRACIDGQSPPAASERYEKDTLQPAVEAFRKRYSEALLESIDWAMEVDPLLRPQNVKEYGMALTHGRKAAQRAAAMAKSPAKSTRI